MAELKRVKLMRGNESSRLFVIPAQGEQIMTLNEQKLFVGDGNKPGGYVVNADNTIAVWPDQTDATKKLSLAWWIAHFNGEEATIRIPRGTHEVLYDMTIPENICLKFDKGATIKVADTKTLTINGSIEAGLWQIFSGEGIIAGEVQTNQVYVHWFGAKGDGSTDDTSSIQKAINYVESANGGIVYFPKGQYKISDTLLITKSNVKVKGDGKYLSVIRPTSDLIVDVGTLNFKWSIAVKNNNTVIETTLVRAIAKNDLSITVSDTTGVEPNMLVYIKGDFTTSPWTSDNRGQATKGETNKVLKIDGTDIYLEKHLYDSFSSEEIVSVKFVKPLTGIEITNLGISCDEDCPLDERHYRGFSVTGCDNALISECYSFGCGVVGFESLSSYKTKITNNVVRNAYAYLPNTTTVLGLGYGLRATNDSMTEITGNRCDDARHCVDISGDYPSQNILVANNVFNSTLDVNNYGVISTHGTANACRITNNVAHGKGFSIMIRGENNIISNNTLSGSIANYSGRNNSYFNNNIEGGMTFYQEDTLMDTNSTVIIGNTLTNPIYLNMYTSSDGQPVPFEYAYGFIVMDNIITINTASTLGIFTVEYAGTDNITFGKGLVYKNNYLHNIQSAMIVPIPLCADMSKITLGINDYDSIITDTFVSVNAPSSTNACQGQQSFRSRMNMPAWYNGSKWVNALGKTLISNAAAAPVDGTYTRGDIVWHSNPSAGGFIGWVCTSGGTPGTWKGFGLIDTV